MVLIEGKKFACGACIKGHRSTSCSHTDRTLVEIGKKGRPPTQCTHCRELRKTSRVHSKCMCGDRPAQNTRRLRVLPTGTSSLPEENQPETFDLVNQILNPCTCSFGGQCCCSAPAHPSIGTRAKNPKKKKPSSGDTPSPKTTDKLAADSPPIQSSAAATCCSVSTSTEPSNLDSQSGPSRSLPSAAPTAFHPYTTLNTLPSPSTSSASPSHPTPLFDPPFNLGSTQNHMSFDSSSFSTQPALFAPRTAGTALCFCGIHCPCPGCVLHDPLGLKFQPGSESQCPTSMRNSEGCIAGIDLPTVNGLLSLSPISDSFPKIGSTSSTEPGIGPPPLPPSQMQIPGVSETFGIHPTPMTTHFSSLEQSFNSFPDDRRYRQTSSPTSGLANCCSSRQESSPFQQTSEHLTGSCTVSGRPGEDPQSPPNPPAILSGCCGGNQSTNRPIPSPNQRAGCCGDAGGTNRHGEPQSQSLIGGCCGRNTPDPSPSNPGPGMVTATRSCCSPTLPAVLPQPHYPIRNRNFSPSTGSTASGYNLANEPLTLPCPPFNHSILLQDQVI